MVPARGSTDSSGRGGIRTRQSASRVRALNKRTVTAALIGPFLLSTPGFWPGHFSRSMFNLLAPHGLFKHPLLNL